MARMPEYVQYFLDCAVETGEMTPCGGIAVREWGDGAAAQRLIDGDGPRREIAFSLEKYGVECALKHATVEEQRSLRAAAYLWLSYHASMHAEMIAAWAYTDCTVGGCREAWVPWSRRCVEPDWRPARRLTDRRLARRYVHSDVEVIHVRRLIHLASTTLPRPDSTAESRLVYALVNRDREIEFAELRRNILRDKERARVPDKSQRKSLRRAALVAATLLGAPAVSAFAAGGPVDVRCGELSLKVTKASTVHHDDHGALRLVIVDDEGAELGKLCWYVPGVNALDQLAALKMYADTDPDEVLSTGNVYDVTDRGTTNPTLLARRERRTASSDFALDVFERQNAVAEQFFGPDYARHVEEFEENHGRLKEEFVANYSNLYRREYLNFVLWRHKRDYYAAQNSREK